MPSRLSPGCPECDRLLDQFAGVVKENAEMLSEYHDALRLRDTNKIEEMRDALAGYDLFRMMAKEELLAHQATHADEKTFGTHN
jgi:hypothetical protein